MRTRLAATRSELGEGERTARESGPQTTAKGLTSVSAADFENGFVIIDDVARDGYTFLELVSKNELDDSDWFLGNGLGYLDIVEESPFGTNTHVTISPGGHVGIGTRVPLGLETSLPLRIEVNGFKTDLIPLAHQGLWFVDDDDETIVQFNHSAPPNRLVVTGSGVGIDTSTPGANFHTYGVAETDVFNAIGPDPSSDGNALNFGYSGATFGAGSGFFNVRPEGNPPNPALYFATGNVDRMLIDNQGYLGVHLDGALGAGFNPAHPIHAR
jgi:hypothetical protein